MKLEDIDKKTILYCYEWIERDTQSYREQYCLCDYVLFKKSKKADNSLLMENRVTKKYLWVDQYKLDTYLSTTKKDAVIKALAYIKSLINQHTNSIIEFLELQKEIIKDCEN